MNAMGRIERFKDLTALGIGTSILLLIARLW